MARAFVIVLDSVGIGAAPDAHQYGDAGSDTIGHIAKACASGNADKAGLRRGRIALPNLARLGLGEACKLASGTMPPGLELPDAPEGLFACAAELSKGKDTPSGHWELAGTPVDQDWHYFPNALPAFPRGLIEAFCAEAELSGILGNCHASGTEIIAWLGSEHIKTGKPICYTSADSVFQIAVHEETFGLDRLYRICEIARKLLDPLRVGRVIARPFVGDEEQGFTRTANRRDYTMKPPDGTLLDLAAGRHVISVGKIGDIFSHCSTGDLRKTKSNAHGLETILDGAAALKDGGLLFANLVDFDSHYGHRRDVAGYAAALEEFDAWLPQFRARLQKNDLAIITADHGCDPTWRGTDHTREHVPVLAFGPDVTGGTRGKRKTFADAGATIAAHLDLSRPKFGEAI